MNLVSSIGGPACALRAKVIAYIEAMSPGQRKVANLSAMFGMVALTTLLTAEPAFAQSNLDGFAQNVLNLLSNTVLRTVAILALIGAGFGWLTGRVNTGALVTVVIGIAIIFSAEWIVTQIAG